LFKFLEIGSAPVTTSLRRINVHPLSKLVENYDELAAALAGTPWAAQLAGEAADEPTTTTGATA